ncbi:MAG: WGR domain-containing protein [Pseudomonadota bacterium]
MNESVTLENTRGTCNKVYILDLLESDEGWILNYANGRIGSSLQRGTKTQAPVEYEKAKALYDKVLKAKLKGGYVSTGQNSSVGFISNAEVDTGIYPQLLNVFEEKRIEELINDDSYWAQEKHDGERKIVKCMGLGFQFINKRGMETGCSQNVVDDLSGFNNNFLSGTNVRYLLDGEAVGDEYFVFDILEGLGQDFRGLPYNERMFKLEGMLSDAGLNNVHVVETARSPEQKRKMYKELKARNAEGIVFKKWNAGFTEGRPNSGGNQLKVKFYATATVFVTKINQKNSVGFSMVDGDGVEQFMGNVTLKNFPVSLNDYIEVHYLYAYPGGKLYQPTLIRVRGDVAHDDCYVSQLKYKPK